MYSSLCIKITLFSNDQASILKDDCVYCGECYLICPQNVKSIVSDVDKVKQLLQQGEQVVASITPSFHALSNTNYAQLTKQLKDIGFSAVEETAVGAAMVKTEYEHLCDENTQDVMITSCCHSVNLLIQKYYPEVLKNLIDVVTPMEAHARAIKQSYLNAKVVFIGPCISKKAEIDDCESNVDVVLTFDDLDELITTSNESEKEIGLGIPTRLFLQLVVSCQQ